MNNKTVLIISSIVIGLLAVNFVGKPSEITSNSELSESAGLTENQAHLNQTQSITPIDSIVIVNFHGTQRCASCLAVGRLTKQSLIERFPEELKSGKIVFKEINGELPENREIVTQYQARGSSLFINAIRSGTDFISEDVTVWRLVNDEKKYTDYLETKLKKILES